MYDIILNIMISPESIGAPGIDPVHTYVSTFDGLSFFLS